MTQQGRYEIVVTNGRKIVYRRFLEDYEAAQDVLDVALETFEEYTVEFFDHTPFAR